MAIKRVRLDENMDAIVQIRCAHVGVVYLIRAGQLLADKEKAEWLRHNDIIQPGLFKYNS